MTGTDLAADGRHGAFDEMRRSPIAARSADAEEKVPEQLRAERGVMDFGVELHGPDTPFFVGDARQCIGADGGSMESRRQLESLVAVAHPYSEIRGQAGEERSGGVFHGNFGVAVFALGGGAHLATEVMHDELKAVTDAENGNTAFEQARVGGGRVGIVDRAGAAGEDKADGLVSLDFAERYGTGEDNGEDILLADAAGDELGILRPEIEDDDCLGVHALVWQGVGGM